MKWGVYICKWLGSRNNCLKSEHNVLCNSRVGGLTIAASSTAYNVVQITYASCPYVCLVGVFSMMYSQCSGLNRLRDKKLSDLKFKGEY